MLFTMNTEQQTFNKNISILWSIYSGNVFLSHTVVLFLWKHNSIWSRGTLSIWSPKRMYFVDLSHPHNGPKPKNIENWQSLCPRRSSEWCKRLPLVWVWVLIIFTEIVHLLFSLLPKFMAWNFSPIVTASIKIS